MRGGAILVPKAVLLALGGGNVHNAILDFNPGRQLNTTQLLSHSPLKRSGGEELKKLMG